MLCQILRDNFVVRCYRFLMKLKIRNFTIFNTLIIKKKHPHLLQGLIHYIFIRKK